MVGDSDADDIVQETLLKMWFLRERLADYSSPEALARVIVRNLCINTLRRRKPIISGYSGIPDIADETHDDTLSDELLDTIASLPDTEQAVLRMKHLEGMETEEIANLIHSTPGAVRTALCRARCRIRKLYNPFGK